MLKKTFDFYSDLLANTIAKPPVKNAANADSGKVRIQYFEVTADGDIDADSVIGLCLIPEGARVIGGAYQHSAFGTGRTLDIGLYGANNSGYIDSSNSVADSSGFFVSGDDVSLSGQDTIADLAQGDSNANYLTSKECVVAAKVIGGTMPDTGTLKGVIKYVVA